MLSISGRSRPGSGKGGRMGIKRWIKAVSATAVVSLALGGAASAEDANHIVSPASCGAGPCEITEGNWGTNAPFGIYLGPVSGSNYFEFQQVYVSSDIAGSGMPVSITQIAFRPNVSPGYAGYAFSTTLPDVTIKLSTTEKEPGTLSTALVEGSLEGNENFGADVTLVYSGSLPLSSDFTGSSTGPKDFDIVIDLQAPFLYDPALGNLLLYVKKVTGESTPFFDGVQGIPTTSRVYYSSITGGPFTHPANSGLVTRFTVTPVPPEPAPEPEPTPPPPSDGQVSAAVKPGGDPKINPKSKGTTPVAIFGTASFDAGTVDPETVTLNGISVKTKPNREPMASLEDVDGDGILDLLVHIDTQDLVSSSPVASAGSGMSATSASSTIEVVLEGKTFDGTPIQGTLFLKVVK
jgi:hypothetical protein